MITVEQAREMALSMPGAEEFMHFEKHLRAYRRLADSELNCEMYFNEINF